MAAREMEAAQKALRKTDYESEDDEEQIILLTGPISSSPIRQRSTPEHSAFISSSFDPYSPTVDTRHRQRRDNALFDDGSVASDTIELTTTNPTMATTSVPGGAGYLEMEEEPPRRFNAENEPITTSSGLLLTHRRHSPTARKPAPRLPIQDAGIKTIFDKSDPLKRDDSGFQHVQKDFFEVEHGFSAWKSAMASEESLHGNHRRHSMPMLQARRFLSYVRIWMILSAAFLMLATGVLFHAFGHHEQNAESVTFKQDTTFSSGQGGTGSSALAGQYPISNTAVTGGRNQIILVPMENISELSQRKQQQNPQQQYQFPPGQLGYHTHHNQQETVHHHHGARRLLDIKQEFENWAAHHGKKYHSHEEKERRFKIWNSNHRR